MPEARVVRENALAEFQRIFGTNGLEENVVQSTIGKTNLNIEDFHQKIKKRLSEQ